MLAFLQSSWDGPTGYIVSQRSYIPATNNLINEELVPNLQHGDLFGKALLLYQDMDFNGIEDYVVSAPGTDSSNNTLNSGAIYLIFVGREPYVAKKVSLLLFYILVTVFPTCCCCLSCACIVFFCFKFRHKEDDVEKIAREAGIGSVKLGQDVRKSRKSNKISPASPLAILQPMGEQKENEVELTDIRESTGGEIGPDLELGGPSNEVYEYDINKDPLLGMHSTRIINEHKCAFYYEIRCCIICLSLCL